MSRSLGGRCVTSLSPIRIDPSLTASRPASARSDVDFPQPEGPTRTRNSPSAISRSRAFTEGRSAPGYCTVAWSYVIPAMTLPFWSVRSGRQRCRAPGWATPGTGSCAGSALDGAGGHALDDPTVEEQEHEQGRNRDEQ